MPEIIYSTESNNVVFEQLNYPSTKEIHIVGWPVEYWNNVRVYSPDFYRVAIFKPKGSTINTKPNK